MTAQPLASPTGQADVHQAGLVLQQGEGCSQVGQVVGPGQVSQQAGRQVHPYLTGLRISGYKLHKFLDTFQVSFLRSVLSASRAPPPRTDHWPSPSKTELSAAQRLKHLRSDGGGQVRWGEELPGKLDFHSSAKSSVP